MSTKERLLVPGGIDFLGSGMRSKPAARQQTRDTAADRPGHPGNLRVARRSNALEEDLTWLVGNGGAVERHQQKPGTVKFPPLA